MGEEQSKARALAPNSGQETRRMKELTKSSFGQEARVNSNGRSNEGCCSVRQVGLLSHPSNSCWQ